MYSQNKDAQLWENFYIEKNLSQKICVHFNHEGRITDNISRFGFAYGDGGFSYKVSKELHLSLDYVFVVKKYYDQSISYRHQYYVSATWKQKLKPFVVYFREMFQGEYDDIFSTPTGTVPTWCLRTKVTAKYKNKTRFLPYTACELYYNMDGNNAFGHQFNRLRNYLGTFYSLDGINSLELYYMVEQNFAQPIPTSNWIIGVGFEHTFY
jgi:hypothetical protein